jgi:hypothetical protein
MDLVWAAHLACDPQFPRATLQRSRHGFWCASAGYGDAPDLPPALVKDHVRSRLFFGDAGIAYLAVSACHQPSSSSGTR